MGEMIAGVMEAVGKDGVVTTEQSQTLGLTKEIVEGMNFDKGYISPYFMTNTESQTAEVTIYSHYRQENFCHYRNRSCFGEIGAIREKGYCHFGRRYRW